MGIDDVYDRLPAGAEGPAMLREIARALQALYEQQTWVYLGETDTSSAMRIHRVTGQVERLAEVGGYVCWRAEVMGQEVR